MSPKTKWAKLEKAFSWLFDKQVLDKERENDNES